MLNTSRDDGERMVEKCGWFLDHFCQGPRTLDDLNPTTRCYPRTIEEAFPDSIERTQWWYPPERSWNAWDVIFTTLGIILWIEIAYYLAG